MIAAGTPGECKEGSTSVATAADEKFTTTAEGARGCNNKKRRIGTATRWMIAAGTPGECREGKTSAVAAADDKFTTTAEGADDATRRREK